MVKTWWYGLILLVTAAQAQELRTAYENRRFRASSDTIQIDTAAVVQSFFRLSDRQGKPIDTSYYHMDFETGRLVLRNDAPFLGDTLQVRFLRLPNYLTREYALYDRKKVVNGTMPLQVPGTGIRKFVPFDGLSTSGSITRGVTVGNNQNAVVNSSLDLQITGRLSDKVSLRASIQDTNIPLQEGGYSQRLDEFDQIFIELFGDNWNIRAGDLFLENRRSRFLNFNKKVQGIAVGLTLGDAEHKTTLYASAALVRGQYARSSFTGQEGNQGPYKLRGPNNELYILVISGSERVYVNGILLKRGESNDYIIDYNAGEITFTSLFPITSEMRINVEYQYSDRNYTRFVTYVGATHETKKWDIGGYVYSENDVKNQPLQQSLTSEQVQALVAAGDDPSLMVASSAYQDTYSENRVLYRKTFVGGVEVYAYSNDPDETLYNVRFTDVGAGKGDYLFLTTTAAGKVFEYVAPIDGISQGNYAPIIPLVAPVKLQMATVLGGFHPSEKTDVKFEAAVSNNDKNLFSTADDGDNKGIALKFDGRQRLYSGKWNLDAFSGYQLIQSRFRAIERLFNIEFSRDWNLTETPTGTQSLFVSGLDFSLPAKSTISYRLEKLDFSTQFSGIRHLLSAYANLEKWRIQHQSSYLKSDGTRASSTFFRQQSDIVRRFGRNWAGARSRAEDNRERLKETGLLSSVSQRFFEYGAFVGRGDSTKVFAEVGYLRRVNDSLQDGRLIRVNQSDSYYLKSRLLKTDKSDLSLFTNYRLLHFEKEGVKDVPSLTTRLLYNDRFFADLIQVSTAYETFAGTIAQQEFSYVEVEPGRGVYTWNDYNGNGLQELQEFEVAPFPDQAKYVRVFLPSQVFIRTHQNRFSQALTLNPLKWTNATGFRKVLSHFYDQASFSTERKRKAEAREFDVNPFDGSENGLLGLALTLRNSLYFNRGKQHHSLTYTWLKSEARSLLSVGAQENTNGLHQLQYVHLFQKSWLVTLTTEANTSATYSENYAGRNFRLNGKEGESKVSYLFSKNASWDVFLQFKEVSNRLGDQEKLSQTRWGTSFSFTGSKDFTANGEVALLRNGYSGNTLSPVAYTMLEGLQPGQNTTWRLLVQKTLTQYLDLNISYQGRKSEGTKAIHTGSIQLRAFF